MSSPQEFSPTEMPPRDSVSPPGKPWGQGNGEATANDPPEEAPPSTRSGHGECGPGEVGHTMETPRGPPGRQTRCPIVYLFVYY